MANKEKKTEISSVATNNGSNGTAKIPLNGDLEEKKTTSAGNGSGSAGETLENGDLEGKNAASKANQSNGTDETPQEESLEEKLEELADFIQEQAGLPMNFWAVAALLESRGLRDVDSIEKFGKRHIFELAQDVFDRTLRKAKPGAGLDASGSNRSLSHITFEFMRFYAKGTVFALPMAGQIAAILILRYSLWAWLDFTVMQASLVALGTIGSFVISGGLVQAIGREGTFYGGQQNPILLEQVCMVLGKSGMIATATVSLLAIALNTILPYFSAHQLGIVLLYFCLLTPLWLVLAMLYMLQDNLAILIATLIGTAVVYVMMVYGPGNIHMSHSAGLVLTTVCAAGWTWFRIHKKKATADKKCQLAKLPRASILLHIIEPFMTYGTLYFTFLFVDRIIGWSASDQRLPVIVWFRTAYELGMDWALLSLVLTFAVLEYTVNMFNQNIIPIQKSYAIQDYKQQNQYYKKFYIKQNILLGVVAIISIIFTYYAILELRRYEHIAEIRDFFASPITYQMYWGSAIGYTFLAYGLLNALFFFSLGKPRIVIRCIAWGLLTDIVLGYLLSRMISYEYSIIGLIAGSGLFAFLICRKALGMFSEIDYYYYSAF